MKLTTEQKDLLIGILEDTISNLDIAESMEFGSDINTLLLFAKNIEVENESM